MTAAKRGKQRQCKLFKAKIKKKLQRGGTTFLRRHKACEEIPEPKGSATSLGYTSPAPEERRKPARRTSRVRMGRDIPFFTGWRVPCFVYGGSATCWVEYGMLRRGRARLKVPFSAPVELVGEIEGDN